MLLLPTQNTGLLPAGAAAAVQQEVLTIDTASSSRATSGGAAHFSVKRAQPRSDGSGHLDVWVFANAAAPLGVHETVFWLNDTAVVAEEETVVRPIRVTIEVINPGF